MTIHNNYYKRQKGNDEVARFGSFPTNPFSPLCLESGGILWWDLWPHLKGVGGILHDKDWVNPPHKLLLVIPGVQACQECQEGQDVYCGRCVQRMFAFPAGPAAPSRDIGEKGHSGQWVGTTIKRRQACLSKLWATDTRVYSQTFEWLWCGRFLGVFEIPLDFPPLQRTTRVSIPQTSLLPSTRHISNLCPPTSTTHKVSGRYLCGLQKNILQTQRNARRLKLLPFSPVFDSAAKTDCLRKIPLGWKKQFFLHGQQIWCHQWFIMLSGVQYVYRKVGSPTLAGKKMVRTACMILLAISETKTFLQNSELSSAR